MWHIMVAATKTSLSFARGIVRRADAVLVTGWNEPGLLAAYPIARFCGAGAAQRRIEQSMCSWPVGDMGTPEYRPIC